MPSMKNKWPVKQKRLGTTDLDQVVVSKDIKSPRIVTVLLLSRNYLSPILNLAEDDLDIQTLW